MNATTARCFERAVSEARILFVGPNRDGTWLTAVPYLVLHIRFRQKRRNTHLFALGHALAHGRRFVAMRLIWDMVLDEITYCAKCVDIFWSRLKQFDKTIVTLSRPSHLYSVVDPIHLVPLPPYADPTFLNSDAA